MNSPQFDSDLQRADDHGPPKLSKHRPSTAGRGYIMKIRHREFRLRSTPFWEQFEPAPPYDIVDLRPSTLPRGKRFETLADAEEYATRTCERLSQIKTKGARRLRQRVEGCRSGRSQAACGRPICAICARVFRRWLIGETLRIIDENGGRCTIVTLLLRTAGDDEL